MKKLAIYAIMAMVGVTFFSCGKNPKAVLKSEVDTLSYAIGVANGAQMIVVEGKNTATVKDNSSLEGTGIGNREVSGEKVDSCGIFLYQSMSGDADTGTSEFNCNDSDLEILTTSSVL